MQCLTPRFLGLFPSSVSPLLLGNGPLPLISEMIDTIPTQQEKKGFGRGRIVVDEWCRVKGADNVFAIGDCCVIDQKPLPPNAQVYIEYFACDLPIISTRHSLHAPSGSLANVYIPWPPL